MYSLPVRASTTLIIPISQVRKLRPRDVKEPVHLVYPASVTISTEESVISKRSFILFHNLAQGSLGITDFI